MPSLLQWLSSPKPKKYRVYVIYGEDAALRADAIDHAARVSNVQERSYLHVGLDGLGAPQVWDAVTTQPMPGITRRLIVVYHADRLRAWSPLRAFIEGSSVYPETTLVLVLDRASLGRRVRNPAKSLPGSPVWETTYEDWEEWLRSYSSAALLSCSPLSIEQPDYAKPSQVGRWLSLRLPVTQSQAAYVWARTGASSALARDVVRALALRGVADATGLAQSVFTQQVDAIIGQHGPADFVEHLLFSRYPEAFLSAAESGFDSAEWRKILGLLGQRLDWLSGLHGALGTNEKIDQVMRRLQIPRHMILHYAHREDARYNIARHYDAAKVKRCRRVLALWDAALAGSRSVPAGFGEALIASW